MKVEIIQAYNNAESSTRKTNKGQNYFCPASKSLPNKSKDISFNGKILDFIIEQTERGFQKIGKFIENRTQDKYDRQYEKERQVILREQKRYEERMRQVRLSKKTQFEKIEESSKNKNTKERSKNNACKLRCDF